MQVRGFHTRALLPLALAMGGALFAALAMTLGANNSAGALTNCTVTHDSNDSEELAFLGLINNYRAQNGRSQLTISTNLNRGSAWMTEDLAENNYFSHTDSLGRSPYSRAIDCGYPSGAGENLAAGGAWASAQAAFTAWQNSPGHNSNMLGQYYQQIGIARFYLPGSQYGWYWATTFGAANDGTGGGGAGPQNTPTNTPTRTPTATNTPNQGGGGQPTATPTQSLPTSTPTQSQGGGSGPQPTQPLPTSTPTQPANQGGGGQTPPTPPLPTSTPTTKPPTVTATPTGTSTPTPSATPTKTPSATPTTGAPGNSLPLSPGANFVAWPGNTMNPADAFKGNTTVAVVYEWDPVAGEWKRYFPGLPAFLNNLTSMKQGGAYWVIAKTKASLSFD